MGFLDKVKQFLNIGGVKVKLVGVGPDIARDSGKIEGKVKLSSKSNQHVKNLKVIFERKITTRKPGTQNQPLTSENTSIKFDTLGEFRQEQPFDISAGEEKEVNFSLGFNIPQSSNPAGMNLNAGKFSLNFNSGNNNEQIEYSVKAVADVDKAAFDPSDNIWVRVV